MWLKPRASVLLIYPRAKYELAILRIINGAIADGFYAMDGVRYQTVISQVRPCPKHDVEWMSLQKEFLRFKIAAVKGIDVARFKLGRDHVLAVLGVKTVGDSEPIKKETPKGPKEDHPENLKNLYFPTRHQGQPGGSLRWSEGLSGKLRLGARKSMEVENEDKAISILLFFCVWGGRLESFHIVISIYTPKCNHNPGKS